MGEALHAHFGPEDRDILLQDAQRRVVRKTARTVITRVSVPFVVHTDHGDIAAEPGDYLATNHPDDDPGSDVWPISAARVAATYEDVV